MARSEDVKSIAFYNQKGGVAKTTSALALSEGLASRGFKVLMIDADVQCNMTQMALTHKLERSGHSMRTFIATRRRPCVLGTALHDAASHGALRVPDVVLVDTFPRTDGNAQGELTPPHGRPRAHHF